MPSNLQIVSVPRLKIDGSDASEEIHQAITGIEVDETVLLPSMFTVRLTDRGLAWINDNNDFKIGKKIEIGMRAEGDSQPQKLLVGEITAIEPEFSQFEGPTVVIRGYDKSFRLHRGKKTRVFLQKKDSDVASQIAQECGLTAQADDTSGVYDYICQDNESDMEFLRERAALYGYFVYYEEDKLKFVKKPPAGTAVDLEWGAELLDFRARLAATEQVDGVKVRAWDRLEKKEIVGEKTAPDDKPEIGESRDGGTVAKTAFGSSKEVITERIVDTPTAAGDLALAVMNEISNSFIQADGTCEGKATLHAGMTVNLKQLGTRFSGKYRLTRVIHRWGTSGGYLTSFEISGRRANTLGDILTSKSNPGYGVVVGVVTDNTDSDSNAQNKLGRVKVKFPNIVDNSGQPMVSTWARLVSPMAGPERGFEFIPEVNDEVLVAFEHDDVHRPYVLGGLWNKTDKPPLPSDQAVANGNVDKRIIQSRSKHKIILDDKQGEEKISVIDKTEKNSLEINSKDNSFIIKADKKTEIQTTSGYKITIDDSGKKIEIACGGSTITMEDTGGIEIKNSSSSIKCSSSGIEIKSGGSKINCTSGSLEIASGGAKVALSGASVNINNGALEVM